MKGRVEVGDSDVEEENKKELIFVFLGLDVQFLPLGMSIKDTCPLPPQLLRDSHPRDL